MSWFKYPWRRTHPVDTNQPLPIKRDTHDYGQDAPRSQLTQLTPGAARPNHFFRTLVLTEAEAQISVLTQDEGVLADVEDLATADVPTKMGEASPLSARVLGPDGFKLLRHLSGALKIALDEEEQEMNPVKRLLYRGLLGADVSVRASGGDDPDPRIGEPGAMASVVIDTPTFAELTALERSRLAYVIKNVGSDARASAVRELNLELKAAFRDLRSQALANQEAVDGSIGLTFFEVVDKWTGVNLSGMANPEELETTLEGLEPVVKSAVTDIATNRAPEVGATLALAQSYRVRAIRDGADDPGEYGAEGARKDAFGIIFGSGLSVTARADIKQIDREHRERVMRLAKLAFKRIAVCVVTRLAKDMARGKEITKAVVLAKIIGCTLEFLWYIITGGRGAPPDDKSTPPALPADPTPALPEPARPLDIQPDER
jgi:hypothetical protein